MQKIFIIGAGYAGRSAALRLREHAEVTLIDERDTLFHRELFWEWLGKNGGSKDVILTPEKWCAAHKVPFIHAKADKLYPLKREIGLFTKERLSYDAVVIATGSTAPRKEDLVGESKQGVCYLGQGDPKLFIQLLSDANYVVIEAGTYAGAAAAVLLKRALPQKELKVFSPRQEVEDFLRRYFAEEKIEVFRDELTECIGEGGVRAVRVKNNKVYAADIVVLDTGLSAHTKSFEALGFFQFQDGAFIVDANQQTKVENIYAVGDATMAHPQEGTGYFTARQRIERQIEKLVWHISRQGVVQETPALPDVSLEELARFIKDRVIVPPPA